MEQLGFKSSHSIPSQKLGFLYGFENIKIAFVPLMILSSHSTFVSGSSPNSTQSKRHMWKVFVMYEHIWPW